MTADTRETFIWRGDSTDESRLTAAIAERTKTELFNVEGRLVYLVDGQFVPVVKAYMREIVSYHIRTPKPINHGTPDAPQWGVELVPLEFPLGGSRHDLNRGPTEKTLINMIDALVPLVMKVPMPPRQLKPRELDEIRTRLKSNEPVPQLARAYNVDVEVIQEIERKRRAAG
jgi:hypothetical protein